MTDLHDRMESYAFADASVKAQRSAASAKLMMVLGALSLGIAALAAFAAAFMYLRLSQLGHLHGWGNIPLELFPIPPETFESFFVLLDWVIIAGMIVGALLALASLSYSRWGLEAVIGKESFHYSWGWTIGTLFIPVVCLYRPWVGFGEVRRAAIGMSSRARVSQEWQSDGFHLDNLIFGLAWLLVFVVIRVLVAQIETLVTGQFGIAEVDQVTQYLFADAIIRLVVLGVTVWYLNKIARAVRAVSDVARAQVFS
jgi:hypothetical protein